MKGSCALVASALAASMVALSSSGEEYRHSSSRSPSPSVRKGQAKNSCSDSSDVTEKFAPKFDGLRFIETLVTAHR